jgi:tryptophan synthase beta chain
MTDVAMTDLAAGYYGDFGGQFVPQILMPGLHELEEAFEKCLVDQEFMAEYRRLLTDYLGRPTPLTHCANLSATYGAQIYLKREDLLHGGAHTANQAIGQALLAKRMGKTKIIAETATGQHGIATALACALLGLHCTIYMGAKDCARQQPNVDHIRLLGAHIIAVTDGAQTLKDACNAALRQLSTSDPDTHYLPGTATGPHPYPRIVKEFQRIISAETKQQTHDTLGGLPNLIIACVGGGSNAIGIFADFLDEPNVDLIGVQAAGAGLNTNHHSAPITQGSVGILHGTKTYVLQDNNAQINQTHSINRVRYETATDTQALQAFLTLARTEGIIPALESAHALAYALHAATTTHQGTTIVINLSGRGDKDLTTVTNALNTPTPIMTDRYATVFNRLSHTNTTALIPYLVIGDPTPQDFLDLVEVLINHGADALELGIAFSDPLADGPTIQQATRRALQNGLTPQSALDLVAQIRDHHPELPIGLLAYANTVLNTTNFAAKCVAAGADSILIPDAPLETDFPLSRDPTPLQRVYILPPNADEHLTKTVAQTSKGYVYVTSRPGVTGASHTISTQIGQHLPTLAAYGGPPAVLGFGISHPNHIRAAAKAGFKGVIIGSALIQHITDNLHSPPQMHTSAARMMDQLKSATTRQCACA